MEAFFLRSFSPVLIMALLTSGVVIGGLHIGNKNDNKGRTPEIKNSTVEDNNQDVAGIRRAAQLPPNIHLNPNQNCYLQYFFNGQPPNIRTANLQNMRYICQELPNQQGIDYYASMHDEGRGIPVYSAYVLHAGNVNFQAQGGFGWIRTAGIWNQATNQIYQGNQFGCHKGHLYPAMTSSGNPANAANSAHSTYQYTNAVPQYGPFNTGQWRVFEGNIRNFAVQTCIPAGGALFLVTGISFVAIQATPQPPPGQLAAPPPTAVPIVQFAPGIDIPNSMWTAGWCSYPNGQCDTFAVIGNNVPNIPGMLTQEITLADLDAILQYDIASNGLKRDRSSRRAKVFPGIGKCRNVRLPREEYPPREEKPPKQPSSSGSSGTKNKAQSTRAQNKAQNTRAQNKAQSTRVQKESQHTQAKHGLRRQYALRALNSQGQEGDKDGYAAQKLLTVE